jgi:ATP-dependent RNA helicase DHX37/DHR1
MFAGPNPISDHLSILSAIGAYLNESRSPNKLEKFCNEHFLRSKAMEEVVKLMQQLTHLSKVNLQIPIEFHKTLLPPTTKQEIMIRQILLGGYVDCVARLDEGQRYGKLQIPVYQTIWSNMKEQFIIHPTSALHRARPAPKWVIFDQVQSKQQLMGPDGTLISLRESNDGIERKWIKGITVIKDTWLTSLELTNRGSILDQPEPRYHSKNDACLGFCSPTYGPKLWELPLTEVELTSPMDKASCFAQALLEGKVSIVQHPNQSVFVLLRPYLVSKATIMMKPWARNQSRVHALLNKLICSSSLNRAALLKQWEIDPSFLMKEYMQWLPEELHKSLAQHWPPVQYINGIPKPNVKLLETLKSVLPKK